jgi:homoserine O-acetyltransferase/O-succinyltransferase
MHSPATRTRTNGGAHCSEPVARSILPATSSGSCYGTTGPASRDVSGSRLAAAFPSITIRDIVSLQRLLVRHLGIRRLKLVIGGSLGGMQVLEWAASAPDVVEAVAPIATSGRHSAWAIALSEAQRQAIYADPQWLGGAYPDDAPPVQGLSVARMIAMSAYRSHASFDARFGRGTNDGRFDIESWLQHHGDALVKRFDANCYVALTRAMDSHDLGRERGSYEEALRRITQPALVVSIDSTDG